ncbi:unnamed protein product [Gongylonema pulchrum]|uniref:LRRCT domain-containing protein n=1 Tax=Gongylonema pulchrum TaxID=637853 RepID=A0A3P7LMP2_9BILA|nr:unnamed protein product [Gongylonema pulchrum]
MNFQIPYLALRELSKLRTLDLESNNITEITNNPEVEFTSEIELKLSNNRIKHIYDNAFDSFQKFSRLDLSYNQISTISGNAFGTISQMRQIDLSYNRIVHIPAGTFKNVAKSLQWMNLEENQLHQLPSAIQQLDNNTISNLKPALTELLLAFNRLTEIPTHALNEMSRLRHLDLSKNRIHSLKRLAFGKFDGTGTSLLKLNLAGNLIENITDPGSFLYMSSLTYLDLSHNRISYLSDNNNQLTEFPSSALANLRRLRYLLLDDNPIRALPDSAIQSLTHLERLSLGGTQLQQITEQTFAAEVAQNLRSLNLAFGHINYISSRAFSKMDSLEQLALNNNKLAIIHSHTFSSLRSLRQLNLADNEINATEERSISDIPTLKHLSLARNRLRYLRKATFVNLNNLEQLDLSSNHLQAFAFTFLAQSLVNLKQLDLSHNRIITVDLNAAKRTLVYLDLAHNQLQSIGKNMFDDFNQLRILKLGHNELIEVQSNAFLTCPQLSELDLSHNHLRIIHKGTFANQKAYESLKLRHNVIISLDTDTFGVDNVQKLDLAYNELKKIPRHAFSSVRNSITVLDLRGNRIRSIDTNDFDGMGNLTELILADNHIETIEEAAFSKMQKLMKLDLSHNPITSWNPHAFQDLSSTIEALNLASTGLFSLPRIDNRGLRQLNISNNKIHGLSAADFLHHRKLTTLDISHNSLKEIDPEIFVGLVELKHLNICGNLIVKFTDKHLQALYYLEMLNLCDMNMLLRLPEPHSFRSLRHLRDLHIYNLPRVHAYNISDILKHLPPLRTLTVEIREPRLRTQLYSADLRLLRKIVITGRQLLKIDTGAFAHLRGYKIDLTIRDTSIDVFPAAVFNTLTAVSFLSLSLHNNRLQTFEPFPHTKPPVLNQHGTILHTLHITSVNAAAQEQPLNESYCADQAGGGSTLNQAYTTANHILCNKDSATASHSSIRFFPNLLLFFSSLASNYMYHLSCFLKIK